MEEKEIQKQKPHTSFNRRLSVVKKNQRDHDNGQEIFFLILFYRGNMTKGEYGKGYYGNLVNTLKLKKINLTSVKVSRFIKFYFKHHFSCLSKFYLELYEEFDRDEIQENKIKTCKYQL